MFPFVLLMCAKTPADLSPEKNKTKRKVPNSFQFPGPCFMYCANSLENQDFFYIVLYVDVGSVVMGSVYKF